MRTPLQRIKLGAILLASVLTTALVGLHYLDQKDNHWLDDLYMVVITVSSVGYGEDTSRTDAQQLLIIGIIILGMSASAYTLGGFFQLLTEGEIERILGVRRMTREIQNLRNHVIVCGYGRIGRKLATELEQKGIPFVVVEASQERIMEASESRHLIISGDATEEETLLQTNIENAKSLVTTLPDDADNVFITLTTRTLCPNIQIIARGEKLSTQKKLLQAGANRVVLPAAIGAMRMAAMITRPTIAEWLEFVNETESLNVQFDEVLLRDESEIVGKTIAEMAARSTHGLLIVAVKPKEGEMHFNPDSTFRLSAGDTLIMMGGLEAIEAFRRSYA